MVDGLRLAVLDDDPAIVELLLSALRTSAVHAEGFLSAEAFLEHDPARWDLVLCDLELPGTDGLEVLRLVRARTTRPKFVIITGHGSIPAAVSAMKEGAVDFLQKPFRMSQLRELVESLRPAPADGDAAHRFAVGRAPAWLATLERARRVAELTSTVLIRGETGTGKDVLARYIASFGPRGGRPLVVLNCGAIPENLIESELFGHVRRAFSGATAPRRGLFEEANGGTLFLDEVGTLPLAAQAKLLRAVEDKAVRRVGDNRSIPIDVRILAATNLDLEAAVLRREFREDLYYRLAVVTLTIPALRDRDGDVPILARYFLDSFPGGKTKRLSAEVLERFERYPFPGNVRELKHLLEQAVAFAAGDELAIGDFPLFMGRVEALSDDRAAPSAGMAALSAEKVREMLQVTNGNRVEAARRLGVSRSTFYRFLRQAGSAEAG